MRFIIACLCLSLVALCQGLPGYDHRMGSYQRPLPRLQGRRKDASLKSIVDNILQLQARKKTPLQSRANTFLRAEDSKMAENLSKLLNVLKQRIVPNSSEKTSGDSNSYELHEDMNKKPAMTNPQNFGLDDLYRFPGSDMMVEMLMREFESPGPIIIERMQDIPAEESQVFYWYLRAMETQWSGCIESCKDDWDGIPELFTRKVTKFVTNLRFSCPSAFFDKLFVRWSDMQLKELVSTEDDSMRSVFYNAITDFFTGLHDDTVRSIAEEATQNVHYWIHQDLTEFLLGEAFRDVEVFSWMFWSDTNQHFLNSTKFAYPPYPQTYRSFGDFFWSAWQHSGVRCETGYEVLARHREVVQTFSILYEQTTIDEIRGDVMSFMADRAFEYGYNITYFRNIDVIVNKVKEYVDDIVDRCQEQENYLAFILNENNEMDIIPLYEFFKTLEDEPGFVWEMFTRLGLVHGSPLISGATEPTPQPNEPTPRPTPRPNEPTPRPNEPKPGPKEHTLEDFKNATATLSKLMGLNIFR